nr:MAG TPA: hypothetical protein [Caudoviricetes sp.]
MLIESAFIIWYYIDTRTGETSIRKKGIIK